MATDVKKLAKTAAPSSIYQKDIRDGAKWGLMTFHRRGAITEKALPLGPTNWASPVDGTARRRFSLEDHSAREKKTLNSN